MSTITVWNKGKRTWVLPGADGKDHSVAPQEFIEMDEVVGLRYVLNYHRDLTKSEISGPSTEDLKRREQSLRDRETALKAKEEAFKEREEKAAKEAQDFIGRPRTLQEAVAIIAPFLSDEGAAYLAEHDSAWKTADPDPLDKDALIAEAKALGLKVDGRMGAEKIKAMIDEAKAAK